MLDGDSAQAVLGRRGTFAIRPERIAVLAPEVAFDTDSDTAGAHRVEAHVAEVVYAGPITRIAATVTGHDVRLTATLLSADSDADLTHGSPVVLTWPEAAVRDLTELSTDLEEKTC